MGGTSKGTLVSSGKGKGKGKSSGKGRGKGKGRSSAESGVKEAIGAVESTFDGLMAGYASGSNAPASSSKDETKKNSTEDAAMKMQALRAKLYGGNTKSKRPRSPSSQSKDETKKISSEDTAMKMKALKYKLF